MTNPYAIAIRRELEFGKLIFKIHDTFYEF